MSVGYDFDGDVIAVRAAAKYSTHELKAAILDALDDARLPPRAVMLLDLRESRSLQDRTADEVREMAGFLASHGGRFGHRLAMVTNGDLAFGLMRLGAAAAESGGLAAEVFRDLATAKAWLSRETTY
jgi:SpoIIAA-like